MKTDGYMVEMNPASTSRRIFNQALESALNSSVYPLLSSSLASLNAYLLDGGYEINLRSSRFRGEICLHICNTLVRMAFSP